MGPGKFLLILFLIVSVLTFIMSVLTVRAQDAAVGDSIALGTGRTLGVPTYASVGASSCKAVAYVPKRPVRFMVVSAGINDAPGYCVQTLFAHIIARKVVVILPAAINSARGNVARLAAAHGYATVGYTCAGGCTVRNFHPASYSVLASNVRKLWGVQ
jgi:hypothetical protein